MKPRNSPARSEGWYRTRRRAGVGVILLAVAACSAVDTSGEEELSKTKGGPFPDANVSSEVLPDGDIATTVSGPSGDALVKTRWHHLTHVLTYELPSSTPFDLQLDIDTVSTFGASAMAYYIYKQTSGYHDSPGCDAPASGATTPCYSPCCADHDQCYDNNNCTWASWLYFGASWACVGCNAKAVGCFGYKATTGDCEGQCTASGSDQVQCYDKSLGGQYCAGSCGEEGK